SDCLTRSSHFPYTPRFRSRTRRGREAHFSPTRRSSDLGALTLAQRHPGTFRSLSAFAPVAAPMRCPWGVKAFTGYLGGDRERWKDRKSTRLNSSHVKTSYAVFCLKKKV